MKKIVGAASIVTAMVLSGCAGRGPQPVAVVQPQDRYADCAAIIAEVQANNQKDRRSRRRRGWQGRAERRRRRRRSVHTDFMVRHGFPGHGRQGGGGATEPPAIPRGYGRGETLRQSFPNSSSPATRRRSCLTTSGRRACGCGRSGSPRSSTTRRSRPLSTSAHARRKPATTRNARLRSRHKPLRAGLPAV